MGQVRTFTSTALEPRDRGMEFGERHHTEIARTVAAYRRLFGAYATEPFDVDLWGERAWSLIADAAPTAAEEIAGIAEGAGVPVREVAALNARTELLAIANPTGVHECSTVVSLPSGRAPVAVQTWDWFDAMADDWLHWTIPHPDGRVVQTVTEYGVLGKIGVNGYGVGVLLNMLHHANDATGDLGFPVHLLSRQIMDTARDLDEALLAAKSAGVSASSSLTVVEGRPDGGRAVSIELFPGGPGLLEPEQDLLVRTNHFVSAEGRAGCLASRIGPGSQIRRDKLLGALGDRPPASVADVVDAMHDHDEVGGICAHPDRGMEPVLQHATLATVVVDTVQRTLQVGSGGPCVRAQLS